ncbi:preprotein translocase subunit SecA, partial [Opitutales bacterium]|nr:preprotein translocase subunit SecA [Opitutales bacterium]
MSLFSPVQSIMQSLKGRQYRKFIKKCVPVVTRINELEKELQSLSDDQLRAKTDEFMQRYKDGTSLDDLLPEAFAVVKNGARRICGKTIDVCDQPIEWQMVHYDVQLIGGMALHERHIAEM